MNKEGIVKVLSELGAGKIRGGFGNVTCECPFREWTHDRGTDRHPSFSVKVVDDGPSPYYCWSCKSKGLLTGLVWLLKREGKASSALAEWVKQQEYVDPLVELDRKAEAAKERGFVAPIVRKELVLRDERELEPFKGKVPKYALNRGLSLETCKEWELGYDESDKRLIFPVRNLQKNLVGVVGRVIDAREDMVYKNYINFAKSNYLYGEHMFDPQLPNWVTDHLPGGDGLLLVEGMFDVLWLWQMGFRCVGGLMGTMVSEAQVQKIREIGRPVYLMQDWDKAGYESRTVAIRSLKKILPLFNVPGPDKKDPGDLSFEEISECLEEARPVL